MAGATDATVGRSKSTLFLMEQIAVITIFAVCAAVCVKILAVSHIMTVGAAETKNALLAAESAAEVHKAAGGDIYITAALLGGTVSADGTTAIVFYDRNWQPLTDVNAEAVYEMQIYVYGANVIFADIIIKRADGAWQDEAEIVKLTAAVREG